MQERTEFHVQGLDCAEEVLLLRRQLEPREGVESLEFDVLRAKMIVTYESAELAPEDILSEVAAAGMRAQRWEDFVAGAEPSFWNQHGRAILTAGSGGLLLAGFAAHALLGDGLADALGYTVDKAALTVPLVARLFYGLSILAGGWFVAPKALGALRRLRPDMNLLMSLAVAGAVFLQQWFEAGSVTFLFSLALLLEQWSMGRARRAIAALMDLSPATARCVIRRDSVEHSDVEDNQAEDDEGSRIVELPVGQVAVGSLVVVRPGEKIPLDGRVVEGASSVNQAPITGESMPVAKAIGDEVFAGAINQEGTLRVQTTKAAADTTLARIIKMVEAAHARRAPSQQAVETFAQYYTPAMMALALAVGVIPPLLAGGQWNDWAYRGLVVLVVACPCALVISTPVSIISALTNAARHGVLIKGGRYLEAAARLRAVALDKTGTLTRGQPVVQTLTPLDGHSPEELLQRAAALESHSAHPLARAILTRAKEEGVAVQPADDFRVLEGRGAEGRLDGKPFWIGSHRFLHERNVHEPPDVHQRALDMEDAGHTVVAVGNSEHICGLISIADEIRDGAAENIAAMKRAGLRNVTMLTGDNEKTAREVARLTGVDAYFAELLPEDKVRQVELLRREHHEVAMIGDGVNDAPAMAASSLGIAMGAMGADAAIESADVALMSDDLSKIPWLITHARRTVRVVRQNIGFALGIKLAFVVLALAGVASLWMAIAADMGASLLVIFNGMRLLRG